MEINTDWTGRRVDGKSSQSDRHRWTGSIVSRVFSEPVPRLLSDREIGLMADHGADGGAALRIALLWDELLEKLERTPTAVLGLLDIAKSGMVDDAVAVRVLEPRLANSIRQAADDLPAQDAWDFIGAIARKMQGLDIPAALSSVRSVAGFLARRQPAGATALLEQPDPKGVIAGLLPSIADGLGNADAEIVLQLLLGQRPEILARLIAQGGGLARRAVDDDQLIERIGHVLDQVDDELSGDAAAAIFPLLIEDRHLPAARPIIARLDPEAVAVKLLQLGEVNDFRAKRLCDALLQRAAVTGGARDVREVLASCRQTARRDRLLSRTLEPIPTDIRWLLGASSLSDTARGTVLMDVLGRADDMQFVKLFSDAELANSLLNIIPTNAVGQLGRVLREDAVPLDVHVRILITVLPHIDDTARGDIASRVVGRYLRHRFPGDEVEILLMLFSCLGRRFDAAWAARVGLERGVSADTASRNMIVFQVAPINVRDRMLGAVDVIARSLQGRSTIDLSKEANDACALLMFDAERTNLKALIDAAGWLVPTLLRARHQPVSLLIAALFPMIYRELAKTDDVPELLKFVPFIDWDRCKTARHEIVGAFMSSTWAPGDLAVTAWRCDDIKRILRRVAKSSGGAEYLKQIEIDLSRIGGEVRTATVQMISDIRADRSHRYDW